ncbi:uncharacterized protein V6R79_002259 [Siganus canaliculatus]
MLDSQLPLASPRGSRRSPWGECTIRSALLANNALGRLERRTDLRSVLPPGGPCVTLAFLITPTLSAAASSDPTIIVTYSPSLLSSLTLSSQDASQCLD